MFDRTLGFDIGAERIKVAEVIRDGTTLRPGRVWCRDHGKDPRAALQKLCAELDLGSVQGAAATGRAASLLTLERIPAKAAISAGVSLLPDLSAPWIVVSIGSHGFAVVEATSPDSCRMHENSRCSQGTGNFLRQLVERFGLTLAEADGLCAEVSDPAHLSGRCPVILKTDMTHLANSGHSTARILAGLYDAVCENVQNLVKPSADGARMILTGGVCVAPRIRRRFRELAERLGMELVEVEPERALFLEALGAAAVAARRELVLPAATELFAPVEQVTFASLPPLADGLPRVTRMPAPAPRALEPGRVILGFDIGSTGAKALALDIDTSAPVWQAYTYTLGNPVGAAQTLMGRFISETQGKLEVLGCGVTGSGREIVGSLLSSCFGPSRVFVLNEIAAHATGALSYDPTVDTIFEIGGQDAKYIRLDSGRICDAAMNEACSAGTGSFIEEQGRKFAGIESVSAMSPLAINAGHGVSLGQHCSVFMAEIIDQAVAAGEPTAAILAGIYDAVVQNYLNRVKGTRSVGNVIFCQGMPFAAEALAAAVARRTGRRVVVPPHPGLVGALGIAILARRELTLEEGEPLPVALFQQARVESRDTFVCPSTKGCGGAGNRCRIDRLHTRVGETSRRFLWGGSCSLYDGGTRRRHLPTGAPDPFTERERLVDALCEGLTTGATGPTVAMTDEFALKGTLPFFATFLARLGFVPRVYRHASRADLKHGIEIANVPYCAPMQLFLGLAARMLDDAPDYLLAAMIRELPRVSDEPNASTCPVVQASPGLLREALLRSNTSTRLLAPVLDMDKENFRSEPARRTCRALARELNAEAKWEAAWAEAAATQERFLADCEAIGVRALDFARDRQLPIIVVLGRAYTIYNDVLSSNVPAILREQGALALPVDCFPVPRNVPVFHDVIWHYSQTNLRAAHRIRRTDDVYGVFCSNYSCGPDSFNLHFFSHVMENKPFAIVETDGHSGDAGTKTRIEAFLYCVESDRKTSPEERRKRKKSNLRLLELEAPHVLDVKRRGEILLVPRMGPGAEIAAAALRAEGLRAEALPLPDRHALDLGRKLTSGKECVPFTITLGSALARIEADAHSDELFALLMPTAGGPCRFGVYNLCDKIAFTRAGLKDRVRLVSPADTNYFAGLPPDFQLRLYFGLAAADILTAGLHDVRPVERTPGAADAIYARAYAELCAHLEEMRPSSMINALREVPRGMLGIRRIVREAAQELAAVKDRSRDIPTVAVVGEIYVRLDPFANDDVVRRLERAGVRAHLAPLTEWLEYTAWQATQRVAEDRRRPGDTRAEVYLTAALQEEVTQRLWAEMAAPLGWRDHADTAKLIAAGSRYVDPRLLGEAILTLGGPLHAYLRGEIDGVVSVGPLECMPNKIAESHFLRAERDVGIPSLTLALNGDGLDEQALAAFVYEVKERRGRSRPSAPDLRARPLATMGRLAARGLLTAALNLIPPLPPAMMRGRPSESGGGERPGAEG